MQVQTQEGEGRGESGDNIRVSADSWLIRNRQIESETPPSPYYMLEYSCNCAPCCYYMFRILYFPTNFIV